MARNEPATHPLLPSSHLWLEMSPPPTLFTYVQFTLRTFATIEECLLGFDNPLCMFALHRSTIYTVTNPLVRTSFLYQCNFNDRGTLSRRLKYGMRGLCTVIIPLLQDEALSPEHLRRTLLDRRIGLHTFQTIHSDYDNTGTIYTLTRPLHSIPSWIYDPLCVALASLVAINDQVSWFEWSASEDTALYVEARRMQQNP